MSAEFDRRAFLGRASALPAGFAPLSAIPGRDQQPQGPHLYVITEFGAQAGGASNSGPAIQRAIDACWTAGGGVVLVPPGVFLTGTFQLRSDVELHLVAGAVLLGSTDRAHYRESTLIEATSARNVSITGKGEINGQGGSFMRVLEDDIYRAEDWRPRMMVLEDCENVRLEGVTLRDSAWWTVHLAGCRGVTAGGLSILNDRRIPNCDGIAVDCSRNVRISGCHIEAGDDCVVLKTLRSYSQYGPCENVVVTGCTLASTSAALKIGTETVNDVRNVVFSDCVVRDSHRGLAIMLRDEGTVENVLFSNMTVETRRFTSNWWGAAEPIHVSALPRQTGLPVGTARDIRFSNILCRSENGVFLHGSEETRPENVVLEGVKVKLERWSETPGGLHDLRPSDGATVYETDTSGIFASQLRDLELFRCTVEWGSPLPTRAGPALVLDRVEELRNAFFRGERAS